MYEMAYSNLPIGTANPGCIIILVDQSSSMAGPFDSGTKADRTAIAVNRVINELVVKCTAGENIHDRCHVAVIGYGGDVEVIIDGMISEVVLLAETMRIRDSMINRAGKYVEVEIEMPVWLKPKAEGWTPMHGAFEQASEIIQQWSMKWPNAFPPVVINITDGEPNFEDKTREAAEEVRELGTTDGNVLVFNVHISNNKNEIILPNREAQLGSDWAAEFLFDISSILPESFFPTAEVYDFWPQQGSRCLAYHASESLMIRLLQFGSMPPLIAPSSDT